MKRPKSQIPLGAGTLCLTSGNYYHQVDPHPQDCRCSRLPTLGCATWKVGSHFAKHRAAGPPPPKSGQKYLMLLMAATSGQSSWGGRTGWDDDGAGTHSALGVPMLSQTLSVDRHVCPTHPPMDWSLFIPSSVVLG